MDFESALYDEFIDDCTEPMLTHARSGTGRYVRWIVDLATAVVCSPMAYAPKIVLRAPDPQSPVLEEFVEACIRDKVALICVVGDQCGLVETLIDELVVADGSDATRSIVTTSHPDEPVADVLMFAKSNRGQNLQVTLRN